jgi:glucans biosynthesis protein
LTGSQPRHNAASLDRRQVVGALAGGAVALVASPALAQTPSLTALVQSALGEGQPFSAGAVTELARALSKRPFQAAATDLPEPFANLNYERYVAIQLRPSEHVWASEKLGFVVEPLARGFVFTTAVTLFTVENGQIRRIPFDRNGFDFGELNVPPNAPDPGFSGFRLYGKNGGEYLFAIIQGATFIRAMAKGQNFGIIARALTLKPAEQKGEEFPAFRAFWIEKPEPGSNALIVHALLDSESVSGAVRMTIRPGDSTIIDIETTLFPRVALEHVGLGGSTASFLFGPNVRVTTDDLRQGAYEAAGLSILNGQGEWLWRPLNNPATLQISAFVDDNPRGFGLLQRERSLGAFQDDAQRYETRPSLWIEPIGDWGAGAVQLIEIPSDAEVNKNILAYWRPKGQIPSGQEFSFAYRQFWAWAAPTRPDLAQVMATRSGRGGGKRRRFLVEFQGDNLAAPPPDMKASVSTSPGTIQNVRIWPYPDRKTVRVGFDLEFGNESACEMRLLLEAGTTALSETWLYRWTA